MQAEALAYSQLQNTPAQAPVLVAHRTAAPALVPKPRTPALGAGYRPDVARRYCNRAAASDDAVNLVVGRPKTISESVKTYSPKNVLSLLGSRPAPVFDQEPGTRPGLLAECSSTETRGWKRNDAGRGPD